jgi:hypothetical protein
MSGEGIAATNLPTSPDVIALVGIKDSGGGQRSVVQIALTDFLTLVANAYGEVSVRAAADAQRAIGIAQSAEVRLRGIAAQVARRGADVARAVGMASNALTKVRLLEASIARVASDARRALGLANNVSNRVSHLDDVQIVLRTQVFN